MKRRTHIKARRTCGGFTMVELIVAMVVSSIVVGFISMMIATPVQAYMAQSRRAELNDSAETAMRALSTGVRQALPNSVRTGMDGSAVVLEMIEVLHVANYRTAWNAPGDSLTTHAPDAGFDPVTTVPTAPARPQLVIGNQRALPDSAYRTDGGSGVITPPNAVTVNATGTHFNIGPAFTFTQDSATNRAYIVGGVTRFDCNPTTGELRRYQSLPITDNIGPAAAASTLIARDVTACSFQITNGNTQHGGLAIIEITFSRVADGSNESLRMVRQVRVENPS